MEEINNILESLRKALQNVDSARVQTERTVNAYNDLQETFRVYILSIEDSVEALNQILTLYKNSQNEMENMVFDAVKTLLDKSNDITTDFERSVQSSINTFNRGIEDNMNNLRVSVSELSEENSKLVNLKREIDSLCQKLGDFKTDIKSVEERLEKKIIENSSLISSFSNETKTDIKSVEERLEKKIIENSSLISSFSNEIKADIKSVEERLGKKITSYTNLLNGLSNETKAIGNNVSRSFDEMKAMYSEGNKKLHNMIVINAVLLIIILVLMFIK